MLRFTFLFILLFCLTAPSAFAAKTNKAGANHLKALFSKHIAMRKTAMDVRGGSLKTNGEIIIERADDYYAITLPAMTLTNAKGTQGEIGLIAINATPTDNPNNWKMSVAIPTPILYKDKNGEPTMRLDIGAQEMGGIWNGSLGSFSKLSAHYSNIKLSHFQKQEILNIEQFNIATDLKESEKGHWSGPTKISLNNLTLSKPNSTKILDLKEMTFLTSFENFTPQERNNPIAEDTELSISEKILKNLGDSFSFQINLKDLSINAPDLPAIKINKAHLDNASISFFTKNLQSNKIQQSIKLNFNGLKTEESENDALLPNQLNLNLDLANLPLKNVVGLIEKFIPTEKSNKASKQVAALQAMLTLPKILSEAGTTLTLSETGYGNDLYETTLSGGLKANPNSIFGATGELIFTLQGIEKTLQKLSEKEGQEANIKKLTAIKEICQKETENDKKKTICHITLDESANLSVNGQDMKLLLDALSGKPSIKDMPATH